MVRGRELVSDRDNLSVSIMRYIFQLSKRLTASQGVHRFK